MTQASHAQDDLTINDVGQSAAHYIGHPLGAAVGTLGPPLQSMAEYHFDFVNIVDTVVDSNETVSQGEAATTAFLIAGSNQDAWDRVRNVAVANTIMRAGLLIHDDLVNQQELRYGRTTVWKEFGMPAAVHLGSALLALAFHTLNDEQLRTQAEIRNRMASCIETIYRARALEEHIERVGRVTLEEVLTAYTGKASATCYFFASGALGAAASSQRVQAAADLGAAFGMALELRNDFDDIWGDPCTELKDQLSNLRRQKLTAAVAYALDTRGSVSVEPAEYYNNTATVDTDNLLKLRQMLEQSGARAWLESQIRECTDAALRLIPEVAADPRAERLLRSLVLDTCRAEDPASGLGLRRIAR